MTGSTAPTSVAATAATPAPATPSAATPITASGTGTQNVVIPIDLETQRAGRPIAIPGSGRHPRHRGAARRTHRAGGQRDTIVPVDTDHPRGWARPLELGAAGTVFGLALDPTGTTVYALVAGGVVPVDTATDTAGATIATGLAVSSVYSPTGSR